MQKDLPLKWEHQFEGERGMCLDVVLSKGNLGMGFTICPLV